MKYIIAYSILFFYSFENYAQDTSAFLKNTSPFIVENFNIQSHSGYLNAKTENVSLLNFAQLHFADFGLNSVNELSLVSDYFDSEPFLTPEQIYRHQKYEQIYY